MTTYDLSQFPALADAIKWLERFPKPTLEFSQDAPAGTPPAEGSAQEPPLDLQEWESLHACDTHHRRKCRVCNHPHRAAMEFDYVNWRDPSRIAQDFGLIDSRPILRHAEATGLHRRRDRRLTSALARLIQQSSCIAATPASIVSAVKIYAQLNGLWVEPPRRIVVTRAENSARSRRKSSRTSQNGISNRPPRRLKRRKKP